MPLRFKYKASVCPFREACPKRVRLMGKFLHKCFARCYSLNSVSTLVCYSGVVKGHS